MIFTPFSLANGITISPAITRVSLFARAISIPLFMAVMVGFNPIFPETATKIISFSLLEQISSSDKYFAPTISFGLEAYAYLGLNF